MKTALHNLKIILSRFKVASTLNVLGLAIAFTVATVICSLLYWEWGFNKDYEEGDRIYQATQGEENGVDIMFSRPMAELLATASPSIEKFGLICYLDNLSGNTWRAVNSNLQISEQVEAVNPAFVEIFELEVVAGDLSKISEPGTAIIPESAAKKYWKVTNYEEVISEVIRSEKAEYRIVGVYKDNPSNSSTRNDIYTYLGDRCLNSETEVGFMAYYKLHKDADPNEVAAQMQSSWDERGSSSDAANVSYSGITMTLHPIESLYFSRLDGSSVQGNKVISNILLSVATIILLIAIVNYFNFFMALTPVRIKSINISKIFGASNSALRSNIVFESVAILLISFGISLIFSELISDSAMNFSPTSLKIGDNIEVVIVMALLALVVGCLVGAFSSWYMTKHSPAFILCGTFGRSRSGRFIRSALTGLQFTVATSMIIAGIFVMLQNKYLKEYDYGFNKERLYLSELSLAANSNKQTFETELKKSPFIQDVSYSSSYLGTRTMRMTTRSENEVINLDLYLCSFSFPEMMELDLIDGRFFTEEDTSNPSTPAIMVNNSAATALKIKTGDILPGVGAKVVGILGDFKFNSLHSGISPTILMSASTLVPYPITTVNIRISEEAKRSELLKVLEGAMLKADPHMDPSMINIRTINECLDGLYRDENDIALMISIFALSCIIIALLGVFGMVVFEAQHSRREVAVRKVFGSSVGEILLRFNSQILRVLVVSSLIALPLSWWGVNKWLSGYPYRCSMHLWVFAVGVIIIFSIVCLMVTLQSYRAASEDPTKNLNAN